MSSIGGLLGGSLLADPIDNILGTGVKKANGRQATGTAVPMSGFDPTKAGSLAGLVPPNNSWEGMNFKTPLGGGMSSGILEQFPQLQAMFGGRMTGGGGGPMPAMQPPPTPPAVGGGSGQGGLGGIFDWLNSLPGANPANTAKLKSIFDAIGAAIPR